MPEIQATNINAFYADLEVARSNLVKAQGEVDRLEKAIVERGGKVSVDEEPVVDEPRKSKSKKSKSKKGKK